MYFIMLIAKLEACLIELPDSYYPEMPSVALYVEQAIKDQSFRKKIKVRRIKDKNSSIKWLPSGFYKGL